MLILFDSKQGPAKRCLSLICVRLNFIQFFKQRFDECCLGTAKTTGEQFIQLTHTFSGLLGRVDIAVDKLDKLLGNLRRNLKLSAQNEP